MTELRVLALIAGKDLRQRLRDRSALVIAFVAPLALAIILSLAFGGDQTAFHARIAVSDSDHTFVSTELVRALQAPSARRYLDVDLAESDDDARQAVADGSADAALIVPAGFTDDVRRGTPSSVGVVRTARHEVAGDVTQAIAGQFAARAHAAILGVLTTVAVDGRGSDQVHVAQLQLDVRTEIAPVTARTVATGRVSAASYYGPSMAILFVFFTLAFGVRTVLSERRYGMIARLSAAPIRPGIVLAGKILATTVLSLASMVVMWLSTSLLFGARWGNPLGVAALCLATVLAAMAIATVIVTLASTDHEAEAYTALVTFALALIGGNFVRLYALPPALQTATRTTPNGWSLAGFVELVVGTRGTGAVLLDIGVVLLFAAVFGAVAVRRANRLLAP